MTVLHYAPIKGRTEEIIEGILAAPEVASHPEQEFTFHLVVEELVSNIVNYAYPVGADGLVDIEVAEQDGNIQITFRDKGAPFDPLKKEDPDINLSVEERPIGGLGIFLVKQMMDSVAYRYEDGQNVLVISKKI